MNARVERMSLRAPAALAGYLCAIVLVTGLLSPSLHTTLQRAGFTGATLEDVTLRVLELAAIVLTVPLLAVLGGGGARAWGVPVAARRWTRAWRGVLIGIASLAPVCVVLFALDVRVTRVDLAVLDASDWLRAFGVAAMSATVVAVTEELWFRGGLFTALERTGGSAFALWGGAAVYAAAHFLDAPDAQAAAAGHVPHGALLVLGQALDGVARVQNVDSFAALLLAGVALGVARLRDGDVALCIGIHAGWVLTIKVFKKLTYVSDATPMRALAGHYDDVIGWLAALALAALALWLWRRPRSAGT